MCHCFVANDVTFVLSCLFCIVYRGARIKEIGGNFLTLGCSCGVILRLSKDSIFALHKTNRTGKTNSQKGDVKR